MSQYDGSEFKAGDLVRVSGKSKSGCFHYHPQGAVVEVVEYIGFLHAYNVRIVGERLVQVIGGGLKLAKQAMKKRDAYASRRG